MKRNILIVALLLILFLALGGHKQLGFGGFGVDSINIKKSVPASDIRSIEISTKAANASIVKGGSDQISATLEGRASSEYAKKVGLDVEVTDDFLSIEVDQPNFWFSIFSVMDLNLVVELPESQYESVALSLGSGNASVSKISADGIKITSGSGNIKFSELLADEASIKTGSGNISGERFEAGELSAKTSSGNITLTDGTAELQAETGSGNIRLELERLGRDTNLKTGSGNVIILLDDEPESLRFDFATGSGNSTIAWPYTSEGKSGDSDARGTFGSGETELTVRTGSGNIRLEPR